MSINRVVCSGNLCADPELRSTAGGTQVLSMRIAVNDRRKNQRTGEWEDAANFVDCTMFGNRAEAVSRYLSKGSKVAVEGKLRYSAWEAKDGSKRSKLEVVVDEIEFMSRDGQQGAQQPYQPQGRQPQAYRPQQGHAPQGQAYQPQGYAPQGYQPQQPPAQQQAPELPLYDADIPF